jgi:hypothetical protein
VFACAFELFLAIETNVFLSICQTFGLHWRHSIVIVKDALEERTSQEGKLQILHFKVFGKEQLAIHGC